jgi:transcriptional regulator with XRE-family HTH domain
VNRREEIGANVRAEMVRCGMTQRELGARTGIGQQLLSKRIRGLSAFPVDELERCAAVMKVKLARLLERRP